MGRNFNWYTKGVEGWYTFKTDAYLDMDDMDDLFDDVIQWLHENIDGAMKHCRWRIIIEPYCYHAEFKFRHEADFIRFTLRWS